jgi:O-antigen ligase
MNERAGLPVGRLERLFAVALIVFSTTAFVRFISPESVAGGGDGSMILQLVWCSFYGVAGILLLTRERLSVLLAGVDRWLLVILGIAFASILWSEVPVLTAQRCFGLLGTVICGLYLRSRFSTREILHIVALASMILAAITILFAVILPGQLHDPLYTSAWRGPFQQKNGLGRLMATGILATILGGLGRNRILGVAGAGMASLVLLKTDSQTSLLALVIAIGLAAIVRWLRRPDRRLAAVGSVLVLTSLSIPATLWIGGPLGALDGVGRDATLTGRSELWSQVWSAIHHHQILGNGFGAFWRVSSSEVQHIWSRIGWESPHAHNGFLDTWLELGLIGVVAIALCLVRILASNLKAMMQGGADSAVAGMHFVFFFFVILMNVSESALVRQNSIFMILMVAFGFTARSNLEPLSVQAEDGVSSAPVLAGKV